MTLNDFDKLVLERLPFGNGGLSIAELAEGLGKNDASGRTRVRNALAKIGDTFDLIAVRGRDDLTRWSCNMYTLASSERPRVLAEMERAE